jgi:pyridoxal-dependent decarboxylase-like protein
MTGSTYPHTEAAQMPADGGHDQRLVEGLEALAREYGNRFLLEPAPDDRLPEHGMRSVDAMRLIGEELVLDGIPQRNLPTFVTTWMEPEAQRIIAENLHRNFIDHAEYPQTAEIEQRCIRMLADLYHAPGETTGARTQGSSEAIMLGALSLKWKWRERREQASKDTSRPNLVFGGDVHVVWEKFCDEAERVPPGLALARDLDANGHRGDDVRREHAEQEHPELEREPRLGLLEPAHPLRTMRFFALAIDVGR